MSASNTAVWGRYSSGLSAELEAQQHLNAIEKQAPLYATLRSRGLNIEWSAATSTDDRGQVAENYYLLAHGRGSAAVKISSERWLVSDFGGWQRRRRAWELVPAGIAWAMLERMEAATVPA